MKTGLSIILLLHVLVRFTVGEEESIRNDTYNVKCSLAVRNSTWDPVCHRSRTMENLLTAQCFYFIDSDEIKQEGVCEEDPIFDPCKLSYHYEFLVCASNNQIYYNRWHMECENFRNGTNHTVITDGHCNITCPYSNLYNPVCGSDGSTYSNVEALACRNMKYTEGNVVVKAMGTCSADPCGYDTNIRVCASNGMTYESIGEAKCQKTSPSDFTILHEDDCTLQEILENMNESEICRVAELGYFKYGHVCGSDEVSYTNIYKLACAAVKQTDLLVERYGPCDGSPELTCNGTYYLGYSSKKRRPLRCGSNGVTYYGTADYKCARKTLGIYVIKYGTCEAGVDPCFTMERGDNLFTRHGVCGTDGQSYAHTAGLLCAASNKPGLTLLHNGYCI